MSDYYTLEIDNTEQGVLTVDYEYSSYDQAFASGLSLKKYNEFNKAFRVHLVTTIPVSEWIPV
jgi:hypothetical protein